MRVCVCVIVCILSVCILKLLITSISITKAQSILTIRFMILAPLMSEGGERGGGVVTFFILEVPDHKSAVLLCDAY